jgi:hypothetical protein
VHEVAIIAGKVFIAPIAVEHNRHVLARQRCDGIAWHCRRVPKWLVIVPHQARQDIRDRCFHDQLGMVSAITFCDHTRKGALVKGVLLKTHRECAYGRCRLLRHISDHCAGVDTATEEGPQRDIAHEP